MESQKLEIQINELADKIDVPLGLIPKINEANDYAKPFIDVGVGDIFYYVIRECGVEYERILYKDKDELLYRIFKDITFEMVANDELKNRNNHQDFRIILFKKQEELMRLLDDHWGGLIKSENDKYME
ncbi:hypothetical protein GNY06_12210 [Elizabethkingia argentiflava]|uniref:Immunity protein 63 domain-containing protein n=1 Tax=Elizabethkingia argenteiflava TaxID=2681556 RepID=A0A845PYW7_9FLAO|nr:Imm63 family immunity protein [Elizabethkingia argenteiflava]NAW52101.1 hypothetical protein [Elizabethkingia argenteiflava]